MDDEIVAWIERVRAAGRVYKEATERQRLATAEVREATKAQDEAERDYYGVRADLLRAVVGDIEPI